MFLNIRGQLFQPNGNFHALRDLGHAIRINRV